MGVGEKIKLGEIAIYGITIIAGLALMYKYYRIADEIRNMVARGEEITFVELMKRLVFAL